MLNAPAVSYHCKVAEIYLNQIPNFHSTPFQSMSKISPGLQPLVAGVVENRKKWQLEGERDQTVTVFWTHTRRWRRRRRQRQCDVIEIVASAEWWKMYLYRKFWACVRAFVYLWCFHARVCSCLSPNRSASYLFFDYKWNPIKLFLTFMPSRDHLCGRDCFRTSWGFSRSRSVPHRFSVSAYLNNLVLGGNSEGLTLKLEMFFLATLALVPPQRAWVNDDVLTEHESRSIF